jgi:hypothetical protein
MFTGLWWGDLNERDHWEDLSVDERIIRKWVLRSIGGHLIRSSGLGQDQI